MVSELEKEKKAKSQRQRKSWHYQMKGMCTPTRKGNAWYGIRESEESNMTESIGHRINGLIQCIQLEEGSAQRT